MAWKWGVFGLGKVWYGMRLMSSFPPQMEIGIVPCSHMSLVMLISSIASVWEVFVTTANNRSEMGWLDWVGYLVRPRPLPR